MSNKQIRDRFFERLSCCDGECVSVLLDNFAKWQRYRKNPPYFSVVKPNARLPNTSIYVYSDLERKHIARTRQRGEYLLNTFPLSLSNGYRMATEG